MAVPLALGRERDPLRQVVGGRRRARRVARAHGQVVLACAGDELPCGGAQPLGGLLERPVRPDVQRVAGVHAAPELEAAEDHVRVRGQPRVDPYLLPVDVDRLRVLPAAVGGLLAGRAAPEDQQVHHGVGAGGAAVRAGR